MSKKPFHEVVLDKMELRVPCVIISRGAEHELRELGEILVLSELPKEKKGEIISRLKRFVLMLSPVGDEARAWRFLRELIEKISWEEK